MEGKDNIKDLFSQKLGNYEAKVSPELWAKISTQVAAASTTTVATGLSLFAKIAIGIGVSAAAITTVVILSASGEEEVSNTSIIEVQKNNTPNLNKVEANKVVEGKTQETVQFTEIRDVRKYLTNTATTASNVTDRSISAAVTPTKQETKRTPEELPITGMPTRNAQTIGGEISQPEIVEGVLHEGMSSYGRPPANQPDIAQESTIQKDEPIKRFVNIFTPNGDGANDYFELPSEGLTDFSVVVFNPTGDIVFQSNEPNFRWDGRDIRSGETVKSGTYMYMVSAYDSEGNPYPIYERLTINR